MIRTLHRTRGASALGARYPGETGPFGVRPDEDDDQETNSSLGDGQADEQQDHRASVRTTDGSAADIPSAANDTTEGAAP